MSDKEGKIKSFLFLHSVLFIYSLSSVFSKLASEQKVLSGKFILFYGIVLLLFMFYAVMWQQVLKQMKLITAYANKAVTVAWGLIWGALLFQESISIWNIAGIVIIIAGVYFVVTGEEQE